MAIPDFYQMEEEDHRVRRITRWIVDIVVVLSLVALLSVCFFTRVQVNGRSMEPVLSDGDVVCINVVSYLFTEPERLDIICFTTTDEDGQIKTSIKRIIGLPGETVQIKNGRIYIDGKEAYFEDELNVAVLSGIAENEITLGEDEYFVLGDYRDSSEDSRFVSIGNVKRSDIVGKVWFRLEPFTSIGLLSD